MGTRSEFYARLPVSSLSATALIADASNFSPVPENWHVVICDIKGSTAMVKAGRQQEVNLVATGSIIAALNIAHAFGTEVPFFFGGDGATLLIPDELIDSVVRALVEHRDNTARNFALELRVGAVPVREVYTAGYAIRVAKMHRTESFSIPLVLGAGLIYAEARVKADAFDAEFPDTDDRVLNLDGMECRWDRVRPPQGSGEVVCLLLNAVQETLAASVFNNVLNHIDEIYGTRHDRNPISKENLRLKATLGKIETEMRAKIGRFDLGYLLENWARTVIGTGYFRYTAEGKGYVNSIPDLADTFVIDGRINTVMSGTTQQREELVQVLDQLEADGSIIYGIHVSRESIMSCYVRNREDQHIHFVDGSDGGYTRAAAMMKRKLSDADGLGSSTLPLVSTLGVQKLTT